jgi:hypothetical protein
MEGKTGEKMLDLVLQAAGCPDVSSSFDREQLLSLAQELRHGRLDNVAAKRQAAGKTTRWSCTPSKLILDWVYGLDLVVKPTPTTTFAYDVTCDSSKVTQKLQKLREFRPLWSGLGIQKVGVILVIHSQQDWGWGALTPTQRDDMVDTVLDSVIYATDEASKDAIRCYTVSF